ncbi:MAG: hypothetical protein QOJ35_4235, partial [Solirubrobacteraceae bacterium]|nr:hypothetical protein [Solirubrobacteraceae bacterium]
PYGASTMFCRAPSAESPDRVARELEPA